MTPRDARDNVDSVQRVRRAVGALLAAAVGPGADLCCVAEHARDAFDGLEALECNLEHEADRASADTPQ